MMLRWVVLLVVLSNIFAALWFHSVKEFRAAPASVDPAVNGIPGIFLLGELSDAVLKQNSTCVLYGVFSSMQKAQKIQMALKKSGTNAIVVVEDTTRGADYWVYIPEDGLGGNPARILPELELNNISSFIFAQGVLERVKRLKRPGYDGEIQGMPWLMREHWLGLSENEQAHAAGFNWQSSADDKITSRKVEIPCERVASPPEFP